VIPSPSALIEQIAVVKTPPPPSSDPSLYDAAPDSSAAPIELSSPARPRSLAPISKSYDIVQQYIPNPMLLPRQRKFDLRVFLLWAKTEPTVVYWHQGYARACIDAWQPVTAGCGDVNKFAHLTNLAVAKVGIETTRIKPQTTNHKPQTTNHKPQTTDHKPQTTNHKPQTTSLEPPISLPAEASQLQRRQRLVSSLFQHFQLSTHALCH
jgi:hypothetical protein